MNLPLAVAVVCLALLGTAEARLGETKDECEKRYGALLDDGSELKQADPEKFYRLRAENLFNDMGITLIFRKADNICVSVGYAKVYESLDQIEMTPEVVEGLLKRNYPDPNDKFTLVNSTGLEGGRPTSKVWSADWVNEKNKDTAVAECGKPISGYFGFTLTCLGLGFGEEMVKWSKEKDKILQQREKEKTQKAIEGL